MMHRYLILSIAVTMLLSPLYVIRWEYLGMFPTTLLELLIWVTVVCWIIWKVYQKDFTVPKPFFIYPAIVIVIASVVSIFVAQDSLAALGIARAYVWEPVLLAIVAYDVLNNQSTPRDMASGIVTTLFLTGVWLSVLGIIQSLAGVFIFTMHQVGRAHAVFNNGNALALFLGPLIVLIVGILFWDRKKKMPGRTNIFLIVLVMLVAFVLARSTGGVLAIIGTLGLFVLGLLLSKSRAIDPYALLFRLVVVGTFAISLVFLLVSSRIAPDVDNPWVRPGGTAEIRLCLWEGTANLLTDNWLTGVGFSGFRETYAENYVTCDAEPLEYPHNFWMTVWAELGVLGVIGFLYLLWEVGKRMQENRWSIGIFLAFTYILLHGLVDVPYFKNDLAVMFWMLIALFSVYSENVSD